MLYHDDVIKWKHFPRYWPFVRGIHRSPVNSPYKGQWRGALMFSLICAWTNGWIDNRDAGDLRRHGVHYDVIVMITHRDNGDSCCGFRWYVTLCYVNCQRHKSRPSWGDCPFIALRYTDRTTVRRVWHGLIRTLESNRGSKDLLTQRASWKSWNYFDAPSVSPRMYYNSIIF